MTKQHKLSVRHFADSGGHLQSSYPERTEEGEDVFFQRVTFVSAQHFPSRWCHNR